VSVFSNRAEAQADFLSFTKPAAPSCINRLVIRAELGKFAGLIETSARRVPFPKYDDGSDLIEVTGRAKGSANATVYIDLEDVVSGRCESFIFSTDTQPFYSRRFAMQLAKVAAGRLCK